MRRRGQAQGALRARPRAPAAPASERGVRGEPPAPARLRPPRCPDVAARTWLREVRRGQTGRRPAPGSRAGGLGEGALGGRSPRVPRGAGGGARQRPAPARGARGAERGHLARLCPEPPVSPARPTVAASDWRPRPARPCASPPARPQPTLCPGALRRRPSARVPAAAPNLAV
ncbi:proapoptotic nucleolar protein 1-like [Rousettus aegyptiacus]|uniref:proapoptotic nucleolar protein 1-like n=1 Tax=Rousettus aegyptiacus TaxID=9407 RepID=UPI00168D0633|nr:proapoptotic nucleolar protein 1-like [Rousettus aegyptiacus]